MMPQDIVLKTLLKSLQISSNSIEIAYAHNYLFEERVFGQRQVGYEETYAVERGRAFATAGYDETCSPAQEELRLWKDSHRNYLFKRVYVSGRLLNLNQFFWIFFMQLCCTDQAGFGA